MKKLTDEQVAEIIDMPDYIGYEEWQWKVEGAKELRDHYEAARAKDAELIQQLVDALWDVRSPSAARSAAAAAGFKPSEQ